MQMQSTLTKWGFLAVAPIKGAFYFLSLRARLLHMEDIKSLVVAVLKQGYLMSLGTADESGPWVSDVIYIYEWNIYPHTKNNVHESTQIDEDFPVMKQKESGSSGIGVGVYWISETTTRHSNAILKTGKAAGTITISNNRGEQNIGLQIEGAAEKVEGDMLELARQHRKKRGKTGPEEGEEFLDKGESWYRLKPTKIELIYEPLFGFDKKTAEL